MGGWLWVYFGGRDRQMRRQKKGRQEIKQRGGQDPLDLTFVSPTNHPNNQAIMSSTNQTVSQPSHSFTIQQLTIPSTIH